MGSERSAHGVDQLLLAERLEHVRGSPGGERLLGESAIAGQRDDGDVPLAADEPRCVDAAQARQPEVQQDDVRPVLAGELDGLDAVMRVGAHHEARILEREPEVRAHERVVLRGEDDRCSGVLHGAPFCGSIASTKKAPGGNPRPRCR